MDIITIWLFWEFITPALADGYCPLETEWQQVSSSLQDSSQYSSRSQQCCSLNGLISNSASPFTNPLVTIPSALFTIGITDTFMFHIFQLSNKVDLFDFFQFYPIVCRNAKVLYSAGSFSFLFFFFLIFLGLAGWPRLGNRLYLKFPREVERFIFYDGFCVVHILLVHKVKFKLLAQFPIYYLPHPVVSSLILFLS